MITLKYLLGEKFQYIHNPCNEGIEWLNAQTTLEQAWENCPRGDWMLWLLGELNLLTEQQELALQVAMLETPLADGRKVLDLITDPRSLAFIDLKRQRLSGVEIDAASWGVTRSAASDAARGWQAEKVREIVPFSISIFGENDDTTD